jgi:hypothetical protein
VRGHALEAARLFDELLDHAAFPDVLSDPESRFLLRLAALFHDLGKPSTAYTDPAKGYTRFPGHSAKSAALIDDIAARLRLSRRERFRLKRLAENHMRPHQLAELLAAGHLTNKAVRRFFLDCRTTGCWSGVARVDCWPSRTGRADRRRKARRGLLDHLRSESETRRFTPTRCSPAKISWPWAFRPDDTSRDSGGDRRALFEDASMTRKRR